MTREEEIWNTINNLQIGIYNENNSSDNDEYDGSDIQDTFYLGVKWADKNPKLSWIRVEDSLPKQDEEVIVLCDEHNTAPYYKISFGHIVDKAICKDYNKWNVPGVVYWFPMPKLPKE